MKYLRRCWSLFDILEPVLPPRVPIDAEPNYQPPRPPPRSLSLSNRFVSESLL